MKKMKRNTSRKYDLFGEQYFGLLSKVMELSPPLQMEYILRECFFKSDNQLVAISKKRILKTLQNFMTKLEQNPLISHQELRFLVQIQLNNRQIQKIKVLKSVFEFFDKVILKTEHVSSIAARQEPTTPEQVSLN